MTGVAFVWKHFLKALKYFYNSVKMLFILIDLCLYQLIFLPAYLTHNPSMSKE